MPVLVTGAPSQLGDRVIDHLRSSGGEVRAYLDATVATDDDAARLRAAGCKVALGELDDEGRLERALEQVHTVAHCWTGPLHDPAAQVEVAATVGSALLGASVRRLIWVRELAHDGRNPYLAAHAEIGELFHALPLQTVMLATGLRVGSDDRFTDRLRAGWLSGTAVVADALHAPVHIDDVARAVAVADRQRGSGHELHAQLALVGPERITLETFLRRLGAPPLAAPRPPELAPPADWVVDWLSRPASDDTVGDGMTLAHGVNRLAGV
ncbi:MAG TPA: NmrA family NAD(P)-binding protein [Euzebyales bacterium]|nr:NmrA family NAD(P)-binding protein [Euzebyales bacterium]